MRYKYKDISEKDIELIRDLWEKNREYHEKESNFFPYEYRKLNFYDRMSHFFSKDDTKKKITIAIDSQNNTIGYCLSILKNNTGEIATLYVEENYRSVGIGRSLLEEHLKWIGENNCQDIFVDVLVENEQAIKFYKGVGFQRNVVQMKIPRG